MVAAKLAEMKLGDNQHTKREGRQICPPSTERAAKALKVSEGSVKNAKTVIGSGDTELAAKVERGEVSVSAAAKKAKAPPAKKAKASASVSRAEARDKANLKMAAKLVEAERQAIRAIINNAAIHVEDNGDVRATFKPTEWDRFQKRIATQPPPTTKPMMTSPRSARRRQPRA